jgi:hypothetical protein
MIGVVHASIVGQLDFSMLGTSLGSLVGTNHNLVVLHPWDSKWNSGSTKMHSGTVNMSGSLKVHDES